MTADRDKWQTYLRLQGSDEEKLRWIADHLGRLHEEIAQLKSDVASLKADARRQRRAEK